MTNTTGSALNGTRLQVDGITFLKDLRATGASRLGTVHLRDAHIHDCLDVSGAELVNTAGPALTATRLQVDGSVFLRDGFRATGADDSGAVRLVGARLGGDLDISGAELTSTAGPALLADRLQVGGEVLLHSGCYASGATELGAVTLIGAHIDGQLQLGDALIKNGGPGPLIDLGHVTLGTVAIPSAVLGWARISPDTKVRLWRDSGSAAR